MVSRDIRPLYLVLTIHNIVPSLDGPYLRPTDRSAYKFLKLVIDSYDIYMK